MLWDLCLETSNDSYYGNLAIMITQKAVNFKVHYCKAQNHLKSIKY